MEAEAIQEGLVACLNAQLLCVEVESYFDQHIQMLRGERQIRVVVEAIVFNIHMVAGKLQKVMFKTTSRHCNKASHEVATFVLGFLAP